MRPESVTERQSFAEESPDKAASARVDEKQNAFALAFEKLLNNKEDDIIKKFPDVRHVEISIDGSHFNDESNNRTLVISRKPSEPEIELIDESDGMENYVSSEDDDLHVKGTIDRGLEGSSS